MHVSDVWAPLPKRVRAKALEAMERTKTHRGPMLNVCLAYTGREDAVRAVMATRREVRDGTLDARGVGETTLGRRLHGAERDDDRGGDARGGFTRAYERGDASERFHARPTRGSPSSSSSRCCGRISPLWTWCTRFGSISAGRAI